MQPSELLFLLGIGIVTAVLLRRSARYFRPGKGRAQRPGGTTSQRDTRGLAARSVEMDRQEVRLQDMARDVSARIDTKMVALEQLLRSVEQEATRLETLLSEARQAQPSRETPHAASANRK